ncbi:MAG: hypothetical protein O2904_02645 [bacterium]|nr:hypothetical protein [bacterium]
MKKITPHTVFIYRVEGFVLASIFYTFFLLLLPTMIGLEATSG